MGKPSEASQVKSKRALTRPRELPRLLPRRVLISAPIAARASTFSSGSITPMPLSLLLLAKLCFLNTRDGSPLSIRRRLHTVGRVCMLERTPAPDSQRAKRDQISHTSLTSQTASLACLLTMTRSAPA